MSICIALSRNDLVSETLSMYKTVCDAFVAADQRISVVDSVREW